MGFRLAKNRSVAASRPLLAFFDVLFGLLLPIPIFIQVQGGFGLYSDAFESTGLSLPVAFFLLPIAVAIGLTHFVRHKTLQSVHSVSLALLISWWVFLALFTSLQNPMALLYAAQWSAPPLMVLYAASLVQNQERLQRFLIAFGSGVWLSLLLLLSLAGYEYFLMDTFDGRMTQNAVFPGMYQLYNYVPEGLVISGLFCAFLRAHRGENIFGLPLLLLCLCLFVPLVTGARGPLLVTLICGVYFVYRFSSLHRFLVILMAAPVALLVVFQLMPSDSFLLVDKFSSIGSSNEYGGLAGNRDVMASLYWRIYEQEPFIGTGMLPPDLAFPELGIDVKSAHNYYLDSLAWGGPIALLGILLLPIFILCEALLGMALSTGKENYVLTNVFCAALPPALAMLLVSSLLRVPLREPYSGPIGFLMLGFVLAGGFQIRRSQAHRTGLSHRGSAR
mgnify:CR=1 FL=1